MNCKSTIWSFPLSPVHSLQSILYTWSRDPVPVAGLLHSSGWLELWDL